MKLIAEAELYYENGKTENKKFEIEESKIIELAENIAINKYNPFSAQIKKIELSPILYEI